MKRLYISVMCLMGLGTSVILPLSHTNIFEPYDWLVRPPERRAATWQATIGYEGAFKERAYQAAEDDRGYSDCFRKRADFLQLYQDSQDLLAALKGNDYSYAYGQLVQKYNLQDDDGTYGLFIPCANIDVNNAMLSARYYLPHGLTLSAHLPVISMGLKDVVWIRSPNNSDESFDSELTDDFVRDIEEVSGMNLHNWSRIGCGDLATILWWGQNFMQARPLLRNVYLDVRAGFIFPTGKKPDYEVLFGLPFGNDAGIGILAGGHLQLWFGSHTRFGIDVQLKHLFGSIEQRAIMTDLAQTDLVLLQKVRTYREPGFTQHFTLYGEAYWSGWIGRVAYQYTRQQEDKLFLGTNHFDSIIANAAESLEEWTAHSVIFSLDYDFCRDYRSPQWRPYLSLFVKHGFNGKRAVLFDTVGLVVSADF